MEIACQIEILALVFSFFNFNIKQTLNSHLRLLGARYFLYIVFPGHISVLFDDTVNDSVVLNL